MKSFVPVICAILTKRLVHRYYLHPTDTMHRYYTFPLAYAILQLGIGVVVALDAAPIVITTLVIFKIVVGLAFFIRFFTLLGSLLSEDDHECDICNRELNVDNFGRIRSHRYVLPFLPIAPLIICLAVFMFPQGPIETIADAGPYIQAILLNFPLALLAGCGYLSRLEFEFAVATDPELDQDVLKGCSKSQLLRIADLADEFSNHANAMTIERLAQGKKLERY